MVSPASRLDPDPPTRTPITQPSLLYRLVDLASRTLWQCAPARGHLASRYTEFLRRMADMVSVGPCVYVDSTGADGGQVGSSSMAAGSAGEGSGAMGGIHGQANAWDEAWMDLWMGSGLDQGWLFGSNEEGVGPI